MMNSSPAWLRLTSSAVWISDSWIGAALAIAIGLWLPDVSLAQEATLHEDFPLEVTAVQSIDPENGFGRLLSGTIDEAGNVYLVDFDNKQLISIAPDGNIRFRRGGEGEGPGEYQMPYRVAVGPDGSVYVFDFGAHSISKVSSNGDFIERRNLEFRLSAVDRFLVTDDGGLVVSGITGYGDVARRSSIHVFDSDLSHRSSFGPIPDVEDLDILRYWGAGGITWAQGGEILFTLRLPYEIYRFALDGESEKVVEAPFEFELGPEDAIQIQEEAGRRTISTTEEDVPRIIPAWRLGSTNYILSGRIIGDVRYWDLFDSNGSLIASTEVPDGWNVIVGYDDSRNRLWVTGLEKLEPVVFSIDVEKVN